MVGNLTLEKMRAHIKSYTDEQLSQVVSRLEGQAAHGQSTLKFAVSYELGGRALAEGTRVALNHDGGFRCTVCDRQSKKLFDGCCYPCFQTSAQADRCVLNPVGCHYMKGTCREPKWGEEFCYQTHYVYLAHTDKLKVGITRNGQVPTRWIDQGATMAVLLAKVGSRHQAGLLEDLLSQRYSDKSHWMKMLKAGNNRPDARTFDEMRREALSFLRAELDGPNGQAFIAPKTESLAFASDIEILEDAVLAEIEFPLWQDIPEKITSLNLEKNPSLNSKILGIKGQYLFLENGVFNVRRHEGFVVTCDVLD